MEFNRATGKSLKVVHTIVLSITFDNKPCFIPIPLNHQGDTSRYRPIDNPQHHLGCRDQLPSSSRNKSIHLLIHGMLSSRYQYSLLIWPRYTYRGQRQCKLTKRGSKTIIGNKMGDKMISTRPFNFAEGNRNIKISGKFWWLRRWTFNWRGVDRIWFICMNFLSMNVDMSKIFSRGGFDTGDAVVSFGDTDEETSWTIVGEVTKQTV